MLALAAAAAVAVLSLDLRSNALAELTGSLSLAAVVLVGASLILVRPGWIGAALGLLALLFFWHLLVAGQSDMELAAIVGVALLLTGELSQWSLDSRLTGRYESAVHVSRAIGIAWLGLLGVGIVVLGQLAAGLPISGGIETVAVAMAAAVALLGLLSLVAARAPIRSSEYDAHVSRPS